MEYEATNESGFGMGTREVSLNANYDSEVVLYTTTIRKKKQVAKQLQIVF